MTTTPESFTMNEHPYVIQYQTDQTGVCFAQLFDKLHDRIVAQGTFKSEADAEKALKQKAAEIEYAS
jgi:hypothetical protein